MDRFSGDSTDRFLVTTTTIGGSIKRIESNFRLKRKNRIAYRDLEHKGGYLGSLELKYSVANLGDTNESAEVSALTVGIVGPGTPAELAGIRTGDQIFKVNDAPVITVSKFEEELSTKFKIGDALSIKLIRDGKEIGCRSNSDSKADRDYPSRTRHI